MKIIEAIEDEIADYNQSHDIAFATDSIRINFSKKYKLESLKQCGKWTKLPKSSNIRHKLNKKLFPQVVTSAYRLDQHDVYYYNLQDPPQYRKACMVIFGLCQYHKEATDPMLISKIMQILKDVTNIDICIDMPCIPDLQTLAALYELTEYKTSTYINTPQIPMIERIVFYDKAYKNNLSGTLWRMEACVSIPNIKSLALPLYELQELAKLVWGEQMNGEICMA